MGQPYPGDPYRTVAFCGRTLISIRVNGIFQLTEFTSVSLTQALSSVAFIQFRMGLIEVCNSLRNRLIPFSVSQEDRSQLQETQLGQPDPSAVLCNTGCNLHGPHGAICHSVQNAYLCFSFQSKPISFCKVSDFNGQQ